MVSPASPPQPPFWYWTARMMREAEAEASRYLLRGIDKAIDDFKVKLKVMEETLTNRQTEQAKRLQAFLDKPDTWEEALQMFEMGLIRVLYSWESQQAYFPKDFEEDQQEFSRLRRRALEGAFGPELQAEVLAYERGIR